MKKLYDFSFKTASIAVLVLVSGKSFANFYLSVDQQPLPQTANNAYYSMSLTGFNHDVIANGNSQANASTTTTIDFSNEFFSADFVPVTPYNGASASEVGGGLPANGQIASAMTPGLTYQLQDYSSNNALLIRPLTVNSGTLTFEAPYTATSVYILWVATESQASTVGVQINFTDGTSQAVSNQIAYDWVGGITGIALSGLGRVGAGVSQWAQLNEFSELGSCKLFEKKIDILPANQAKGISGVTFTYSPGGNYQSLVVFAINVFGEPLGVDALEKQPVSVYPNPSSGIFNIHSDLEVKNVSIVNSLGQEVRQFAGSQFSLGDVPTGIYHLKAVFENGQEYRTKIVKK